MTRTKRLLAMCTAAAMSLGAVAVPATAMTTMKMSRHQHMSMHKGKMMHHKHMMMHHKKKMMKNGM